MRKSIKVMFAVALSATMVASMGMAAFADETEAAAGEKAKVDWRSEDLTVYKDLGPLKIGYAPATMNNPFWLACEDGVKEALDAAGVEYTIAEVDGSGDQAKINDGINNLIADKIDVLIAAPADVAAAESAFKACVDAGIPIVNFDTPVDEAGYGDLCETIIASDNYNAGYVCGADVAAKFPDGLKLIVAHSPRATSCTLRYAGFFDALDEAGVAYEKVNELDGQGDTEASMKVCADALVADPDVDVIFAINDPSVMGCLQAVDQATVQLEKDIKLYGVDGNPDVKKLIKDGKVEGTGSQSPNTLGYDSAVAALKILSGEEVPHDISVDTFLITSENVDDFGTDGWQ